MSGSRKALLCSADVRAIPHHDGIGPGVASGVV